MWNPRLRALAVAFVVLSGCATGGSSGLPRSTRRGVDLTVENDHAMDIRIFVLRGSSAIPLGTLVTLERRTFHIDPALLGKSGVLRLAADPVGSRLRIELMPVQVHQGQSLECTLAHDLKLTTFRVR